MGSRLRKALKRNVGGKKVKNHCYTALHCVEIELDFEFTEHFLCYITILIGVVLPMLCIAFVCKHVLTWHDI